MKTFNYAVTLDDARTITGQEITLEAAVLAVMRISSDPWHVGGVGVAPPNPVVFVQIHRSAGYDWSEDGREMVPVEPKSFSYMVLGGALVEARPGKKIELFPR